MLRNDTFAFAFMAVYLFVYCLLLQFESAATIALIMLILSPFFICATVYMLLKNGKYGKAQVDAYAGKKPEEIGAY